MERLTEKQRTLVEKNHGLIFAYLRRHALSMDDYYDICALGLCQAAQTYSPERGKFTTLAFSCMKHEIIRSFREVKREPPTVSVETIVSEDQKLCLLDLLGVNQDFSGADAEAEIKALLPKLTPREAYVLRALIEGETQRQIAETLGVSRQAVNRHVKEIQKIYEGRKKHDRKRRRSPAPRQGAGNRRKGV